ncbi:hypothetical protein Z949_1290 [Sulfitobacter guttiformis KCTC 32187]|nr:hypothetical protein Z949_1290 [Sulfitobacter guttiformis KCTC 32187]
MVLPQVRNSTQNWEAGQSIARAQTVNSKQECRSHPSWKWLRALPVTAVGLKTGNPKKNAAGKTRGAFQISLSERL